MDKVPAWRDPAVWEGAVATGQPVRCSPGLAGLALKVVDQHAELYRRYDGFAGGHRRQPGDHARGFLVGAAPTRQEHW